MRYIIILFTAFIYSCTSYTPTQRIEEFYKPIPRIDSVAVPPLLNKLIKRELCTSIMFDREGNQPYFLVPSHNRQWLYKIILNSTGELDSIAISKHLQNFDAYYAPGNGLIYMLDITGKQVNMVMLRGDSIFPVRKINYPGLTGNNRFFVSENFKLFPDSYSLAMNYLLWKNGSKSYTDTGGLIVTDTGDNERKILTYPDKFKKERVYANYLLFDIDTAGQIAFTYESYDSLFVATSNGKIIKRGILHHQPVHPVFNERKEPDLAYVRKYQSLGEKNIAMKVINESIVTIKKLTNTDLLSPARYKYFVHNMNLKELYADTFRMPVTPGFISSYKDGFVMLSHKLDQAYFFSYK